MNKHIIAKYINIAGKDKTPAQILAAHDAFMSGEPLDDDTKAISDAAIFAACFGASAFDLATKNPLAHDAAPIAMLRAMMIALIDPTSADLDHLRGTPSAGDEIRAIIASAKTPVGAA